MDVVAAVRDDEVFAEFSVQDVGHGARVGDDGYRAVVEGFMKKSPGVVGLLFDKALARREDSRVLWFVEIEATGVITRPNSKRFEVHALEIGNEAVGILDDRSERLDEKGIAPGFGG